MYVHIFITFTLLKVCYINTPNPTTVCLSILKHLLTLISSKLLYNFCLNQICNKLHYFKRLYNSAKSNSFMPNSSLKSHESIIILG